jgi:hypothetical protein
MESSSPAAKPRRNTGRATLEKNVEIAHGLAVGADVAGALARLPGLQPAICVLRPRRGLPKRREGNPCLPAFWEAA